jgi:hypothetical protein
VAPSLDGKGKLPVPSLIVSLIASVLPQRSTCATYGNPDVLPITETTPTVPINPYGKAKLAAEVVVRDFAAANPVRCPCSPLPLHPLGFTSRSVPWCCSHS